MANDRRIIRGEWEDAQGNVLHANTSAGQVITADGKTIEDKLREYDNMAEEALPEGGKTGQVLAKKSDADRDTHWIAPPQTETGATILNKIKEVDGASSGLDADLLDGKQADAFAAATHTHAAEQVGAAAKDHTHTPQQIGAAEANHTHTPQAIGAAPAVHTHTPDQVGAAPVNHTHTSASIGAAPTNHAHAVATTSANGFMDYKDKNKLDKIKLLKDTYNLNTNGEQAEYFSIKTAFSLDKIYGGLERIGDTKDNSDFGGFGTGGSYLGDDTLFTQFVKYEEVNGNTVFTILPEQVDDLDWSSPLSGIAIGKEVCVFYTTETGKIKTKYSKILTHNQSAGTITFEGLFEEINPQHIAVDYTSRYGQENYSGIRNGMLSVISNLMGVLSDSISFGDDCIASRSGFAFGKNAIATMESVAFGRDVFATRNSFAFGEENFANIYSVALGQGLYSDFERKIVVGENNDPKTMGTFIVGVGPWNSPSNGFRVEKTGKCYAKLQFSNTGADFAEFFEWADGNLNKEDRRGRFVTLDGSKIRLATSEDDFILGVISARPCLVGNDYAEEWNGKFLTDIYGTPLMKTYEEPAQYDDEGNLIKEAYTYEWFVVNPDYNEGMAYKARELRPEWGAVGLKGQVVVVDDGTCQVNGYCLPSNDGIATATSDKRGYRVMQRKDDNHVLVYVHDRVIF